MRCAAIQQRCFIRSVSGMPQYYFWQIWHTVEGPIAHIYPALPLRPGLETAEALVRGLSNDPYRPLTFTKIDMTQGPIWFGHPADGATTYIIAPEGPVPPMTDEECFTRRT
jgi:hypothetical protein